MKMTKGCTECREGIDAWLAQGAVGVLERQFTEHVSECHACARYLAFSMRIEGVSSFGEPHMARDLPDRIAGRVLDSIDRKQDAASGSKRMFHRYVLVAAALVVTLMPFLGKRDAGFSPVREAMPASAQVRLELKAPHAESVVVVGDWNGWNVHADRLAKADEGETWSIEMELQPGREYRYQFVIDGDQWIPDPHAYMQVDDGFGGLNSVLEM